VRECGLKRDRNGAESARPLSLPVRECGLKLFLLRFDDFAVRSLPVRECGLKRIPRDVLEDDLGSLPVRECGLKQELDHGREHRDAVTPRAGVWIETTQTKNVGEWLAGHSPCGSVD